jgi:hypothetical protein
MRIVEMRVIRTNDSPNGIGSDPEVDELYREEHEATVDLAKAESDVYGAASLDDLCDALNEYYTSRAELAHITEQDSDQLGDIRYDKLPVFGDTWDHVPTGIYSYDDTSVLVQAARSRGESWMLEDRV